LLLGDWLKKEREKRNITQFDVAETVGVSQAKVSFWENNKSLPSILDLYKFSSLIGLCSLAEIPFEKLDFNKGDVVMERMSLYELPTNDSIRTFEGRTYELKGFLGVEKDSGEVEQVTNLYYRARTVVKNNQVTAKRKNESDELKKIKPKKIKSKAH
jgi:transcriptional regulator with XRE-family HTH domain